MKQISHIFGLISLLLIATFLLSSCLITTPPKPAGPGANVPVNTNPKEDESDTNQNGGGEEPDVVVTKTSFKLMAGKDTETMVYKYVTNKEGPKMIIVGGTHGDEVAGWTTALNLVAELDAGPIDGMCGELLIIPQLNKLADEAVQRYVSSYNGVTYSDLNRAFPIERAQDAASASIELANACISVIEEFIGANYSVSTSQTGYTSNLCIIDLHESRGAQSEGYLGNDLICTNNTFLMEDFLAYYNKTYKKVGEENFVRDEANKSGSFSMYFSETYPDAIVFTVETNRARSSGQDTIALSTRTRQQRNILNTLFDMVWNRVDKADFE